MNLDDITPLILTFNEESNIGDTLNRLKWARQIIVVDSFSTDATVSIARSFDNVTILQRHFDHFASQCNYGLQSVESEWTLSLDADYKCPADLPRELATLSGKSVKGYWARFTYCVYGYQLRAAIYPPRLLLYRTKHAKYAPDGHAHRVTVLGESKALTSKILHDDRKPLPRWLESQAKYAELEARKLLEVPRQELGWKDRLRRRYFLAPLLTLLYCLLGKGLLLDGLPGVFYTLQRVYAELLLSLKLLDRTLLASVSPANSSADTTSAIAARKQSRADGELNRQLAIDEVSEMRASAPTSPVVS